MQLLEFTSNDLKFRLFDEIVELNIHLPNKYLIYNVLSVFATVYSLGLDWKKLVNAFSTFTLPEGRGQSILVEEKDKVFHLYDDTYNANPLSLVSAISSLSNIENPKKRFLILGDMKELGKNEVSYHLELQNKILEANPAKIILCGELMEHLWKNIEQDHNFSTIKKAWYGTVNEVSSNIDSWIEDGDHIVLKASNSMGLKKIIDRLSRSC